MSIEIKLVIDCLSCDWELHRAPNSEKWPNQKWLGRKVEKKKRRTQEEPVKRTIIEGKLISLPWLVWEEIIDQKSELRSFGTECNQISMVNGVHQSKAVDGRSLWWWPLLKDSKCLPKCTAQWQGRGGTDHSQSSYNQINTQISSL